MMGKIAFWMACAVAMFLTGCFGGPDREVKYYMLPVPEVKKATADPVFPYTLMVTHASVDPAYRRNNIVYRESPYDFMFYTYSVWAARPEFLVEQSVTSMMKSSALFGVLDVDVAVKPDLEFMTHVNAVEEVDRGNDRFARLAVTFTLRKTETEGFIWRKAYDESRSYKGDDMRNFAEAVYELLKAFADDAIDDIRRVMSFVPEEHVTAKGYEELPAPEMEEPAASDVPATEAPAAPEVEPPAVSE